MSVITSIVARTMAKGLPAGTVTATRTEPTRDAQNCQIWPTTPGPFSQLAHRTKEDQPGGGAGQVGAAAIQRDADVGGGQGAPGTGPTR
jgi:hypothetical protein